MNKATSFWYNLHKKKTKIGFQEMQLDTNYKRFEGFFFVIKKRKREKKEIGAICSVINCD